MVYLTITWSNRSVSRKYIKVIYVHLDLKTVYIELKQSKRYQLAITLYPYNAILKERCSCLYSNVFLSKRTHVLAFYFSRKMGYSRRNLRFNKRYQLKCHAKVLLTQNTVTFLKKTHMIYVFIKCRFHCKYRLLEKLLVIL